MTPNKQLMGQFIRFINTKDYSLGETIVSPDVIFHAPTSMEPLLAPAARPPDENKILLLPEETDAWCCYLHFPDFGCPM